MSATALGKATSVVIKGLLVLFVIGVVGWSLYVTIIRPTTKPNPTTRQEAETIVNPSLDIRPNFGGCANLRVVQYYIGNKEIK